MTFAATLKSLLLTHAYMSGLNIVISGIGPGIGIVQDCWLRFLGTFPDAMKHPSGLSSYHSPDMELSGFAHKIRTLQYTLVTFSLSSRRILSCHSLYRSSVCAILKQPHGIHELRFPNSNIYIYHNHHHHYHHPHRRRRRDCCYSLLFIIFL